MAWLRLDDGFDTNHKILELREVERWRWTRVLVYCAKNRNKGVVTATVLRELGLEKTVQKLLQIGLLNELSGNAYRVHDWYVYNGESLEERVGAYMADHPEATANEVYRVIGGKRSLVLKVFADRSLVGSTEPPTRGSREPHASGKLASGEAKEQVPGNHIDDAKSGSSEPGSGGSLSGPRARAHRRAPLPTPKNEERLATEAAAGVQSTSSTSESHSAANRQTEELGDPAAAVESPTESDIREACTRFGADLNVVEPIARQLPGAVFAAIVTKHAAKVKRGSVDDVPAHFVHLLKAELKDQARAAAKHAPPMPPTRLPENERPVKATGEDWVRHIVPTLTRHPFERVAALIAERAEAEDWTPAELEQRQHLALELHQAEAA